MTDFGQKISGEENSQQVEVIDKREKFLIQIRHRRLLVFASFDEDDTRKLKKEIDEWLTDWAISPREKKAGSLGKLTIDKKKNMR